MLDSSDPDWPYKMTIYQKRRRAPDSAVPRDHGLWSYHSRDGVAWETLPGPLFAAGDRNSLLPERLKGLYVNYCRHERMMELCGRRRIFRTQSPDFVNWTGPQLVLAPDLDDEIGTEYYGMSVFRRHGWFLGLLEVWNCRNDLLTTHLAYSRDGLAWHRPRGRQPFIGPAFSWNRMWSSPASNGPIIVGD